MVKPKIVGAHYGLKDWLVQRISALLMAIYTVVVAGLWLSGGADGFERWRTLMAAGSMRFATFLFIVSLCWHAWVGVRDLWMDYVQPVGIKLALHVLTLAVLTGYAGWAVQIIWRL